MVRICANVIKSKATTKNNAKLQKEAVITSQERKSYARKGNYYVLLGSAVKNIYITFILYYIILYYIIIYKIKQTLISYIRTEKDISLLIRNYKGAWVAQSVRSRFRS